MKTFFRTYIGKTILFIAVLFFTAVFVASAAAGTALVQADAYTGTAEDLFYSAYARSHYISKGYDTIWLTVNPTEEDPDASSETTVTPEVSRWADDGNLVFMLEDENGQSLVQSASASPDDDWQHVIYFGVATDENGDREAFFQETPVVSGRNVRAYTFSARLMEGLPNRDGYRFVYRLVKLAYDLRYLVILFVPLAALIAVFAFVALMCVSARRPEDNELHPGPLNRVPFDLLAAAALGLVLFMVFVLDQTPHTMFIVVLAAVFALLTAIMALGLCTSLAGRVKQGTLIKGSFCYQAAVLLLRFLKYLLNGFLKFCDILSGFISSIPLVWKTCLFLAAVLLCEFLAAAAGGYDSYAGFTIFEHFIFYPLILYIAVVLRRLQKGGEALASGDLSQQVNTKGMVMDFKRHGEDLNNIAGGMNIAVSEKLKSERMKTELITNVSHDIKTPLTSIINYATLIGQEETENQKVKEYSEVLVRQSDKLKRLIEDLVEASKASTGNLEVHPAPCDASIFVEQASGEYEEKLEKADLKLVVSRPEQPVMIMADGRRMWRIFDNLMNNICKYAQPGTRVYLSLEEDKTKNQAVITFKNTSRDALNISEEELMERFTRGDSSRNTEGNGLGLSIARSMAELQGGTLKLAIDGDLFKAILSFPLL